MTSPYLTQPLRTLEQAIAEKLKRPVPVGNVSGNMQVSVSTTQPVDTPRPRMVVIKTAAEGGDD